MTFSAFEAGSRLITAPPDPNGCERAARLKQLGLGFGYRNDPRFDELARHAAQITGAPIAMVNFIDEDWQYFAGMFAQAAPQESPAVAEPASSEQSARVVSRDQGYCPHVVVRRKALVLEDVCDYPRFVGDPTVDDIGIRSYMAAPLIDRTGMPLGTVCVADLDVHPWGRAGLEVIKSMAAEVVQHIHRREQATV